MSLNIDYYELLQVERSADDKQLKSAYRKMAMQYHPDRNPGDAEAEARFKALNQAYDCLKDPQKRAAYDRYGREAYENAAQGGGGGHHGAHQGFGDFADIFESFFGGGQGGGRSRGPARGADLRYDLEISLDQAFHGVKSEITIDVAEACDECDGSGAAEGTGVRGCNMCGGHGKVRAQQGFFVVERTCPTCNGTGEIIEDPCRKCRGEGRVDVRRNLDVEIPAGVDNGTRVRLSGKGEAGQRGTAPGDLYIFIHVKKHKMFEREGTTLFCHVPVSFTKAALGGEVEIPGLDGEKHVIKIPAGTQSGKHLRKRGAGMPVLQGHGHGDLVVQIDVETPTRLTERQRELLCEFQETETGRECPQSKGFFDKVKEIWDDLTD
ncbi:molecular chaperone DnaJ [Sphingorhabdus lutea]|uniref:Chaperone protein DnaJ n=1 Tax=Sphingorhabdus lutea TaxID=1913578 RepID=A0A1L3JD74_9SPHN|nr:molecular chaperone DnaJ [Sphingorhabdus lutea]APG63078.1 molecular chaperone DnaJ [Sphingorhabdus lutea]